MAWSTAMGAQHTLITPMPMDQLWIITWCFNHFKTDPAFQQRTNIKHFRGINSSPHNWSCRQTQSLQTKTLVYGHGCVTQLFCVKQQLTSLFQHQNWHAFRLGEVPQPEKLIQIDPMSPRHMGLSSSPCSAANSPVATPMLMAVSWLRRLRLLVVWQVWNLMKCEDLWDTPQ